MSNEKFTYYSLFIFHFLSMIGILHHPKISRSQPLASEIEAWLQEQAIDTWVGSTWNEESIHEVIADFTLLIVLGGDGSILRAARIAAAYNIPLFNINLGKLGFLSEVEPADWQAKLIRVLNKEYWLEKRMLLQATGYRNGQVVGAYVALNEIVVARGTQARVVRLGLFVDGDHVTTYTADGLIVATPTGSTAYSMAAGGPILPPQLQNFLVMPVAPHLSLNRAVVLHQDAVVMIKVHMDHEATLTADGQDAISLQNGDTVVVRKHQFESCFARVSSSSYFYDRLMQGLGLSKE